MAGTEIPGGGGRGRLYLTLHCHHQNDSCIKMGSDESQFNVSLIVRDRVTRQCPHATTSKERGEPKRNRTEVPLATSLTPCARLNWLTWMNVPLNVQREPSWKYSSKLYSGSKKLRSTCSGNIRPIRRSLPDWLRAELSCG